MTSIGTVVNDTLGAGLFTVLLATLLEGPIAWTMLARDESQTRYDDSGDSGLSCHRLAVPL